VGRGWKRGGGRSLHLDCFVLNSSLVESIYSAKEVHSYTEKKALAEIENSRLDCMSHNCETCAVLRTQDSIACLTIVLPSSKTRLHIYSYICVCVDSIACLTIVQPSCCIGEAKPHKVNVPPAPMQGGTLVCRNRGGV